jgi:hypothetical protein
VIPSPSELLALECGRCGGPLAAPPGAAVFPCPRCGAHWEPARAGQAGSAGSILVERPVWTARATTGLASPPETRCLGVWLFPAKVEVRSKRCPSGVPPGAVWDEVRKAAAPREPRLYVPAFDLRKFVVGRLGRTLVEGQPAFEAAPGFSGSAGSPPSASADPPASSSLQGAPPLYLGETEARVVARFVYMAVEAGNTRELRGIDFDLTLGPGALVFLPAAVDPRAVRDANLRFLFREFDSLVV